jgi:hypothetical protein
MVCVEMAMKQTNVLSHIVFVKRDQHRRAITWCREHLGSRWDIIDNRSGQWTCFWAGIEDHDRYRFYFATAEDAVVFSLKWS